MAAAILERAAAEARAEALPGPRQVRVFRGRGIAADVNGRQVLVGNIRLMEEMGLKVDASVLNSVQEEAARGRTVALVAVDGRICGWISLADRIRESARNLVPLLHRVGVRQTVMLTGDSAAAAAHVAATLGIDRVEAGLLPEDKVKKLRELSAQGFTVAMVGDGINDAPALSAADVSIALGAGTDVALEAADVALITDNLEKIAFAIGLARAIVTNVRQNLTFAVAVVLTLVAGVLFGRVHLASGMLIHEISVLAVILNGVRLLYLPSPRSPSPLRPAVRINS